MVGELRLRIVCKAFYCVLTGKVSMKMLNGSHFKAASYNLQSCKILSVSFATGDKSAIGL